MSPPRIAVVMPVGPGSREAERARDTVASLRAWEPAVKWVVLIDDEAGRRLEFPGCVTLRHPLSVGRGTSFDRIAAATWHGFVWARDQTPADFVMKLDSDALVIAPFATKLALAGVDTTIGLIGSYDRTCNGDSRSFESWAPRTKRISRSIRRGRIRRIVHEARRHGYRWGEHALGAAVAVPRAALDRLALEPVEQFCGTGLGDDPALGILVRAAGFRPVGDVSEGGTFALAWHGLPDSLDALQRRRFSIIHSVKNDPHRSESEIREFFRSRRAAPAWCATNEYHP